jgi:hypothetical protein
VPGTQQISIVMLHFLQDCLLDCAAGLNCFGPGNGDQQVQESWKVDQIGTLIDFLAGLNCALQMIELLVSVHNTFPRCRKNCSMCSLVPI